MAKSSKRKQKDPITINNIYEAIKERNFAQELWMDVISDIGDKPTYKRIKEMVKCVVNNKLGQFQSEPTDNAERLQRRDTFTEISIMAYTVDRVISEFLYRRLQNEFKSMIGNMLKELQTKKSGQKDANPAKIDSLFENIESIFTRTGQSSTAEGDSVKSRPVEASQTPVRKRGRPKKNISSEIIKESSIEESSKDKDSDADSNITLDSISSVHTTDLSSFDDNISICADDGDNGRKKIQIPLQKASSMITEGRLSSVYHVEALQAEDIKMKAEKKRKRQESNQSLAKSSPPVSLKVLSRRSRKPNSKYNAETMYCQVKDYSSRRTESPDSDSSSDSEESEQESEEEEFQPEKKAKVQKLKKEILSPVNTVLTRSLRNGSSNNDSVGPKIPPPSVSSTLKQDSEEEEKPPEKKAKVQKGPKEIQSPVNTVFTRSLRNGSSSNDSISQKIPPPSSSSTPNKSSAQRYASSDLYKPRFHFGNRSASAFTSFSS